MIKSLTSKLHLERCLYFYSVFEDTSIQDQLIIFKQIVADLETLEIKYDEEDLGLKLLCSLPAS